MTQEGSSRPIPDELLGAVSKDLLKNLMGEPPKEGEEDHSPMRQREWAFLAPPPVWNGKPLRPFTPVTWWLLSELTRYPGTNTNTIKTIAVFFLLSQPKKDLEVFYLDYVWEPMKGFRRMLEWANENMGGPNEIAADSDLADAIIAKAESTITRSIKEDDEEDEEGNEHGRPSANT